MHLPFSAEPVSESFKSDWIKRDQMLVEDNSNTTNSSSASPSKSQNTNPNEFWWTERMVLRAQEEFPNELGSKSCDESSATIIKMIICSSHRKSLLLMLGIADALAIQQNSSRRIQSRRSR